MKKIQSVVAEIFHVWYFAVADIFHLQYFEGIFRWKSSSIWILLHFKEFLLSVWSPNLKSKFWERSNQWLLRYSTFDILRSSSNRCHLHFKHFLLSVYSPKLKFKVWRRSDQWLLRYYTINIHVMASNYFFIFLSPSPELNCWRILLNLTGNVIGGIAVCGMPRRGRKRPDSLLPKNSVRSGLLVKELEIS